MKKLKYIGEVVKRYCPQCRRVVTIAITEDGAWERWRCENGHESKFKTQYGGGK